MTPFERLRHALGLAVLAVNVVAPSASVAAAADDNGSAIRPFRVGVSDEALADLRRHWLTNSATSAGRLYWENGARGSVLSAAAQNRIIAVVC